MEKSCPLVSICMPAYNVSDYVGDAVRSILAQSYTNWELIIVNDGSTDNTATALNQFSDRRIRIYEQENRGQCAAANEAYKYSRGQLIKFMDADDLISPMFIEDQVRCINDDNEVIASASWGRFYGDDLTTFKLNNDIIRKDSTPIDWLVTSMDGKQPMMQCALWLIPKTVLDKSGLWDERLSLINDFEFFIRVLLSAREIRFPENALLFYRSGLKNSLSSLKSVKGAQSAYDAINWGTSFMLNFENSTRVKSACASCFQNFIYSFYPHNKNLIKLAELRVAELGGAKLPFPSGGYTKFFQKLIGWKNTKTLKLWLLRRSN
jgi:glycosyltransferase involved in cell wall biosynthesis